MIYTFLFSFHEQFLTQLGKWPSFLVPTSFCLACMVIMEGLSGMRFLLSLLTGVLLGAAAVIASKAEPSAPLLHILGVHLPIFTLFTLVAPPIVLAALLFEVWGKYRLLSGGLGSLVIALLVGANIELLNGLSLSMVRAQDYATQGLAFSYFLGTGSALASVIALPPLIAGAFHQSVTQAQNKIVLLSCFLVAALSSIWLLSFRLTHILQNIVLLYGS